MTRTANRGILGTNLTINADAVAVGDAASAVSMTGSQAERRTLLDAIERLDASVRDLSLKPPVHDDVRRELARLSAVAAAPQVNRKKARASLSAVLAKLSAAGVVISQVAGLVEPVQLIAKAVGLALGKIG